jgi:GNAT superfamily N-acetyltransferase
MTFGVAIKAKLDTPVREFRNEGFLITTARERLDVAMIHEFLTASSWAKGISRETVEHALKTSFCFGVYEGERQVGFARVITDFATFAYICDFFIMESHRGRGLAKWLISSILECPEIHRLQRTCIVTAEAHGLYRQMGFMGVQRPDAYLELVNKDAYK